VSEDVIERMTVEMSREHFVTLFLQDANYLSLPQNYWLAVDRDDL
jgi:hypothetical protein